MPNSIGLYKLTNQDPSFLSSCSPSTLFKRFLSIFYQTSSVMKKFLFVLLIALLTLTQFSCKNDHELIPSKTFVLIAGAWQGAWAWDEIKGQLEKAGQSVIVVELPAHGDDSTSPAQVSIDVYRDKVIAAMGKAKRPVTLVGHSMAGMVISAVAEKIPSQIEKLIYIAAYVPANGQSLLELATSDQQSLLPPALHPSEDGLTLDVAHDQITNIFVQDGSTRVKQLLLRKFRVEPAIPFTNQVMLTTGNFGSVNKYYIKTLQDHVIGPELQNRMIAAASITQVYSLDSGHSPSLSQPQAVTALLLKIASNG